MIIRVTFCQYHETLSFAVVLLRNTVWHERSLSAAREVVASYFYGSADLRLLTSGLRG